MTITSDARALLAEKLKAKLARREFPLSFPQQRPWFLDQLQPENPVYNLPLGYRIRGQMDVEALQFGLTEVVRRHEVLRSLFITVDGQPRQMVQPAPEVCQVEVLDLSGSPNAEARALELADEEARASFDLSTGPVLRARLLRIAADDHLFLLSLHHIACDAWSVGIIGREVSAAYRAHQRGEVAGLPELPMQYADFADWQVRQLHGPARMELLDFWRSELAGIPASINLPTDRPRPAIQSYHGAHVTVELPAETVDGVEALARQTGTTPYAVLLSGWAALLHRYTGGEETVIGTPVANRHLTEVEQLVGFFTNTLVLRPDHSGDPTVADFVARLGQTTRQALAHQDLPFELLVQELQPDRDTAYSPVFQVMFIYWEGEDDAVWDLPGCEISHVPGDSGTAKFDLTLSLTRHSGGVSARLEYATALHDESTARRMAEQYVTLLSAAVADPSRSVTSLPILPSPESELVLQTWAHGPAVSQSPSTVHRLIEAQVARTPDATAVIAPGGTLSYAELDARAEALAARLRGLGVRPGVVVGVYLDRSIHTVVALLGILKASGAYLPLDPTYPVDRLGFMVADSGAPVVVTTRESLATAAGLGAAVVTVDGPAVATSASPVESTSSDLAYLIYTSGSTGRPKGVKITHANVAAFFAAMDVQLGGDEPGTWLAVTSISFDISVLELLWTFTRGYRVVLRRDFTEAAEGSSSPARQVDFSLFYFGNASPSGDEADRYRLVLEGAEFADRNGFTAVWTPERHFHDFGGLYPNPSVLGAAIAARTKRVAIRAGSVVLPLHDPLRVAEEWALVDNLSGGRIGVSFASGWAPNDFVLAPEVYADRKQRMLQAIDEVRNLWRGGKVKRVNGSGAEVEVGTYPRPVTEDLPVWLTSARHPETFRMAGEIGAGLLTHLVGHSAEQLAEKIELYRQAWRESDHPGSGHVTLMLHTFAGEDVDVVRETVRAPLREYIRSSFDLLSSLGQAFGVDVQGLPADQLEALLDRAADRFFDTSGLFGTPEQVADTVEKLAAIGVDEVGCLIDFGVDPEAVLASLPQLARSQEIYGERRLAEAAGLAESAAAQLKRFGVTHLQCTPSLASTLVSDSEGQQALAPLRRMLVGGEALPPELARALAIHVGGDVHNMYGPTEATVWATSQRVTVDGRVRIGSPLAGYSAYVVDAQLRPAPIGVPGELLLGGPAIAPGYHERPELTEDRFIPDPFSADSSERLYRTGDLVRWVEPCELEFLGRLDHQIKLRGRRIELGEIDAVLASHAGVQAAVADVRGEGDARGIVAYWIPAPGTAPPSPSDLRAFLAQSLPDHMLPATFVALQAFPRTPNNKIDRKALPEPDQARPELATAYTAPRSVLEQTIVEVWCELLPVDQVGVHDNFFELGGNSILVVGVRSRLMERLERDIDLIDLFRYASVSALAAALEQSEGGSEDEDVSAAASAGARRRAALVRTMRQRQAAGSR